MRLCTVAISAIVAFFNPIIVGTLVATRIPVGTTSNFLFCRPRTASSAINNLSPLSVYLSPLSKLYLYLSPSIYLSLQSPSSLSLSLRS